MTEMFLVNLWILRINSFYQNKTTSQKKLFRIIGHWYLNQILSLSLWHFLEQLCSFGPVSHKRFSSGRAMAVLPLLRISHGGVTFIITTVSWMSFQIRFLLIRIHRDSPAPMQFSIPFIPKPSETLALGWKNLRLKLFNYDTFSVFRIHSLHIGYQKFRC